MVSKGDRTIVTIITIVTIAPMFWWMFGGRGRTSSLRDFLRLLALSSSWPP
jgi:hypothetical protein